MCATETTEWNLGLTSLALGFAEGIVYSFTSFLGLTRDTVRKGRLLPSMLQDGDNEASQRAIKAL